MKSSSVISDESSSSSSELVVEDMSGGRMRRGEEAMPFVGSLSLELATKKKSMTEFKNFKTYEMRTLSTIILSVTVAELAENGHFRSL